MTNTFELNGVTVIAKPFSFNTICDLEDYGVSMDEAQKKPMKMLKAYIGICTGVDSEEAGQLIEQHLVSGGSLDDVTKAMVTELNNSDFFRNLNKGTKKKATKTSEK